MKLRRMLWLFFMLCCLCSCGTCVNTCSDWRRDVSRRDYHITLYAADGKVVLDRDLIRTYVAVSENGSGLR